MSASFTVTPTTGYSGATLAVTATGTATSWLTGSTFSVSGGTGAAISGLVVDPVGQVATFNLYVGTAAGTLTIADSVDSDTETIVISAPSFTITPSAGNSGRNHSVTATGTHTSWNSATKFAASGTGSVVMVSVDAPTQATFRLYTGNSAATVTVSDSADDATAAFVTSLNPFVEQRWGRKPLKRLKAEG